MHVPINKQGNIEISHNQMKYRMPLSEIRSSLNVDVDSKEVEKSLKRKLKLIEDTPYYLIPHQIETIHTNIVFYYDLTNYQSFLTLREIPFEDKLKYFISLIEIAKKQEEAKVLWDRLNFVVDIHEENVKAVIFETDHMPILEKTEPFQGVKELIIISLTTLDKLYGKPKRSDFLEKSNEVIQFAETVLKIEDLEDLEHYINTKHLELETSDHEEEASQEESNKKKFLNKKDEKKLQKKKPISSKQIKKKDTKKNKKSSKFLVVMMSALIVVAFIANFALSSLAEQNDEDKQVQDNHKSEKIEPETIEPQSSTAKEYEDDLLKAYRYSLNKEPQKAIEILENIGYGQLSEEDQNIMLNIYNETGQLQKMLDLNPNKAKEIVNEVIANEETDKLIEVQKEMETSNPYVDFEVAVLKQDSKKVISLKDQVELNGRKEQQIVDAYLNIQKYDEAKKFAEKVGNPDLMQQVNAFLEE